MQYEWDEKKNESNFKKHGYYLADAEFVFSDPFALTLPDERHNYDEDRFITVGMVGEEIVLSVCHTDRSGITRIISVRRAGKKERKVYNDHRKNDI